MNYPADDILLARGKYSTLGRERHEQIQRVQKIAKTLMGVANPLLQDCQEEPPSDEKHLEVIAGCLKNAQNARERLIELCKARAELKPLAWGDGESDD